MIDESITRSIRIAAMNDGSRRSGTLTKAIEMDSIGNETQMMLTIEFDPNALTIDATSFPNENPDITLGAAAPTGTTIAVNANEARAGRITVTLDLNGPIPSGRGERLLNLSFRTTANGAAAAPRVTLSDTQVPGNKRSTALG